MMANIQLSHRRYQQRQDSAKNKESCIHKRVLEDANEAFKGNKKLKKIVKEDTNRGTRKSY